MIKISEKRGGVVFEVRVVPRASKTEIVGELEGALKIRLAAPPVEGEANDALARFLAKEFSVSRSNIKILKGIASKTKLIRVSGISALEITLLLRAKI
jgi:uncharacterized protein (TIGR00251 family)